MIFIKAIKFKFGINPLKDNIEPIKISEGFEIDYIDDIDINVLNEV